MQHAGLSFPAPRPKTYHDAQRDERRSLGERGGHVSDLVEAALHKVLKLGVKSNPSTDHGCSKMDARCRLLASSRSRVGGKVSASACFPFSEGEDFDSLCQVSATSLPRTCPCWSRPFPTTFSAFSASETGCAGTCGESESSDLKFGFRLPGGMDVAQSLSGSTGIWTVRLPLVLLATCETMSRRSWHLCIAHRPSSTRPPSVQKRVSATHTTADPKPSIHRDVAFPFRPNMKSSGAPGSHFR